MGRKYCLNYFSLNTRPSKSESMLSNNHCFEVTVIYYTITLQIHLNDYNTQRKCDKMPVSSFVEKNKISLTTSKSDKSLHNQ